MEFFNWRTKLIEQTTSRLEDLFKHFPTACLEITSGCALKGKRHLVGEKKYLSLEQNCRSESLYFPTDYSSSCKVYILAFADCTVSFYLNILLGACIGSGTFQSKSFLFLCKVHSMDFGRVSS